MLHASTDCIGQALLSGNRGTSCIVRACTVLARHDHLHSRLPSPRLDRNSSGTWGSRPQNP
eukprot:10407139-Alexandrium_andersonii.AAC.1